MTDLNMNSTTTSSSSSSESSFKSMLMENFGTIVGGLSIVPSLYLLQWIARASKKRREKKAEFQKVFTEIRTKCRQEIDEQLKDSNSILPLKKQKQTIGVLIVNLGTPSQATPNSVHQYLSQFLMDRRVVDVGYWFRVLLVRGLIVPFRYKKSTAFYQEIWKDQDYTNSECSPLKYNTTSLVSKVTNNLQELNDDKCEFRVEMAMRYQEPSIEKGLKKLENCSHIVVVPMFPQYASATTGSIHEECMSVVMKWRTIPNLHFNNSFNLNELFIKSSVKVIRDAIQKSATERDNQPFDHLLLTYHSLPIRHVALEFQEKNDLQFSYYQQCLETSLAILKELFHYNPVELVQEDSNNGWFTLTRSESSSDDISSNFTPTLKISTCFQSRLGKEPWLQPYTSRTLNKLAKKSSRVLVACPSFVSDCIETDHELEIEEKEEFYKNGGKYMAVARCVNDDDTFAQSLTEMIGKYKQVL